jgi:FtsP/CotA-like multicopper oxidase with cupredoxin domain
MDPSPTTVSVELVAAPVTVELAPGHTGQLAGYAGSVPGPLIRAKPGDLVQVHFRNALSENTTVHFHGLRLPNAMDGVPEVTQPPVPPGGTFDYSFVVPDAGLFWYHPHVDSVAELGSGLYGPILVSDPNEPADLGDEVVLVLSDVTLDENGVLVPPATDADSIVAGNVGNTILVNGLEHPRLHAQVGRRLRLRVLNAARTRFFKLALPGQTFLQIGSDGGLLEAPVQVAEPLITPGERLDLLVEPTGAARTELELVTRAVSRGLPLAPQPEAPLLTLALETGTLPPSPPLPAISRAIAPLDLTNATELPIALTMDVGDSSVTMGINGVPSSKAEPVMAQIGQTQVLVVENQTPYEHPFHLHGYFFQPLDDNGVPKHPLAWKDTIDVPPVTRVKLAAKWDDRPGMWMFHCHILDHADNGMMGMLHVMP